MELLLGFLVLLLLETKNLCICFLCTLDLVIFLTLLRCKWSNWLIFQQEVVSLGSLCFSVEEHLTPMVTGCKMVKCSYALVFLFFLLV